MDLLLQGTNTHTHTYFNFYYYYCSIPFDDDVFEYMMVTNGLGFMNDEEQDSFILDSSIVEKVWLKESEPLDIWDW